MPETIKTPKLKKELGLFNVYAIAAGATLSSGFFLLPGLAFVEAGPAMMLSYIIAAIILVPALFSQAELATAMPRAGGVYYFLDRSMGPLMGTIGGIGTWFSMIFKAAFALVGIGAYLHILLPGFPLLPLSLALAVVLGLLNLREVKAAAGLQVFLVFALLGILMWFAVVGAFQVETERFAGFFDKGFDSIFATAGLVFISYLGVSKIASVSEEVKNPERNLPLAMFLALGTAVLVYLFGMFVMIGVIPEGELAGNLNPVATAANHFLGPTGRLVIVIAALFAFMSVANAAIMSGSRYPLAMSRDAIFPEWLGRINKNGVPAYAVGVTVACVAFSLVAFDAPKIAKLAGAFQLMLFALNCFAVIIMRESKIDSYDPGFKSPLYPWMQIFGFIASILLISQMGFHAISFTVLLLFVGALWYFKKVHGRVTRVGAIYHIFERLGQRRFEGLDSELRGILKEKGLRKEDPFDEVVTRADVIDLTDPRKFEDLIQEASIHFSKRIPVSSEKLRKGFLDGTGIGATPISHGAALPHVRIPETEHTEIVLVRARKPILIATDSENVEEDEDLLVQAVFFVVSPENNPGQHLRLLAQIAGRVDDDDFMEAWLSADDDQTLKEVLLRDERYFAFHLKPDTSSNALIGHHLYDLNLPQGCLIAMIRRGGMTFIPRGLTVLEAGDRLTMIGDPDGIHELQVKYL